MVTVEVRDAKCVVCEEEGETLAFGIDLARVSAIVCMLDVTTSLECNTFVWITLTFNPCPLPLVVKMFGVICSLWISQVDPVVHFYLERVFCCCRRNCRCTHIAHRINSQDKH